MARTFLAIESSCDDMAVAICRDAQVLSSVIMRQEEHARYGGVVPEVASRAHLKSVVPGIRLAMKDAGVDMGELDAIAVTAGPGLLGSLSVGLSAAKGLAAGLGLPLYAIDHMDGHLLSPYEGGLPELPSLTLTVSGGHTQLTWIDDWATRQIVGRTLDDAVGEAYDKIGKMMGLAYPAGREMDELAQKGSPNMHFAGSQIDGLDMSFSGLKTQVRYFLQDQVKVDHHYIQDHLPDLAYAVQHSIMNMLEQKMRMAIERHLPSSIAVVGGVSANSGLRQMMTQLSYEYGVTLHLPPMGYTMDNAAMIALAAYHLSDYLEPANLSIQPYTRQRG